MTEMTAEDAERAGDSIPAERPCVLLIGVTDAREMRSRAWIAYRSSMSFVDVATASPTFAAGQITTPGMEEHYL
jgi:hypothetical protein